MRLMGVSSRDFAGIDALNRFPNAKHFLADKDYIRFVSLCEILITRVAAATLTL